MEILTIPGFSEPISSLSHLLAAIIFTISGVKLLIKSRGNWLRSFSLFIFVASNIFLFSMSGVYHLLEPGSTGHYVLKILDHDGIYLLIAGTFTPIHIILTRGLSRWLVLFVVWMIGVVGIVFTSIYLSEMPNWLTLSFYLGMGWIGLFTLYRIFHVCKKSTKYMVSSGLFYTIGALVDAFGWPILWNGVFGPHEFFHVFVVLGAVCHWRIMFHISEMPISINLKATISEYPNNEFLGTFSSENIEFTSNNIQLLKDDMLNWVRSNFFTEHMPKEIDFHFIKKEKIKL